MMNGPVRGLTLLGAVLKTGLSIAIIVIIATQLNYVWLTTSTANGTILFDWPCLLGPGGTYANSLCVYAYVVAGFSLILSLTLLVMLAISFKTGGANMICEAILSMLGMFWWIAAGVCFTHYSQLADGRNWPRPNWRHSIFAMCWAQVGIYLFLTVVYLIAGCRKAHQDDKLTTKHQAQQQFADLPQAIPVRTDDGVVPVVLAVVPDSMAPTVIAYAT